MFVRHVLAFLGCCMFVTTVGCGSPAKPARRFEVTPATNRDGKGDVRKKRQSQIPYLGGRVLHHPRVVNLFWGVWWNTSDGKAQQAIADGLAASLAGTSYLALVTQYTDGNGAPDVSMPLLAASVNVADSEPPAGLADEALQAFVATEVDSGAAPYTSDTVFMILTPPGVALASEMGTSCEDTCAYHNHVKSTGDRELIYAIVPSLDCWDVCGAGDLAVNGVGPDLMTLAYSHELAEAITDPLLDAWTKQDGEDEIGDRCDGGSQLDGNGQSFAVQDLWSNDGKLCAASYE